MNGMRTSHRRRPLPPCTWEPNEKNEASSILFSFSVTASFFFLFGWSTVTSVRIPYCCQWLVQMSVLDADQCSVDLFFLRSASSHTKNVGFTFRVDVPCLSTQTETENHCAHNLIGVPSSKI